MYAFLNAYFLGGIESRLKFAFSVRHPHQKNKQNIAAFHYWVKRTQPNYPTSEGRKNQI